MTRKKFVAYPTLKATLCKNRYFLRLQFRLAVHLYTTVVNMDSCIVAFVMITCEQVNNKHSQTSNKSNTQRKSANITYSPTAGRPGGDLSSTLLFHLKKKKAALTKTKSQFEIYSCMNTQFFSF